MIWPWRSNPVNKAMLVYLNFCLAGALNCSVMTYYLALLFSDGLGKESPSRYNLFLLCLAKLFEWHSDFRRANYIASHNRHIRSQSLLVVLRISWLHLSFIPEAYFQCHFHFAAGDNLWHQTFPLSPIPCSLYLDFLAEFAGGWGVSAMAVAAGAEAWCSYKNSRERKGSSHCCSPPCYSPC